jgi:hypothetical protein
LSISTFPAHSIAAFTVTGQVGTFVAMNDGRAGFQADGDAIVFLKNFSLSATNFWNLPVVVNVMTGREKIVYKC